MSRPFLRLIVIGALALRPDAKAVDSVPVRVDVAPSNGATVVGLSWTAQGASVYEAQTVTSLVSRSWTALEGSPISPSNLIGQTHMTTDDPVRFFRVRRLDTQGPIITHRYPATDGLAIGRSAAFVVRLDDATGVDTNAFSLTINANTNLGSSSLGVSVTTNGFQYVPSTNVWGDYGGTATVEFVCADLFGNATTSSWSFTLELQPVLTNALVHLQPPTGGAKSRLRAALADSGRRRGVPFSDHLSIVSIDTNRVVLAYTGGSHELYVGAVLINHDPAHFFYRRITALADDPGNSEVTVETVHVHLTDIVEQGSFTPEVFLTTAKRGYIPLWEEELGYTIPFSHESELTVAPIDITEHVRLVPSRFSVDLEGSLGVSLTISDWAVKELDARFTSELSAALRSSVEFREAVSLIDWSTSIGAPITLVTVPIGAVGPIPVWVEVRLVPGWGVALKAAGAVQFETGIDAYAETDIRIVWTPDGWTPSHEFVADINHVPLDIGFKLSAEAYVYLRLRLDAVLCPVPFVAPDGLAGIYADYQRGPSLKAVCEIGATQCELTLSDKQAVDMGLTVVGFDDDDLPNLTLFEHSESIVTWYWPEIQEQAPVFTRHPEDVTAAPAQAVTLSASASGNPFPSYQWYQNHVAIPFQTSPQLTVQAGARSAGEYYVTAVNRLGRATSESATVTVVSGGNAPSGMVYIPAGSFSMGDSFNEGRSNERPVHSVYVTGFYMDRYEVTKALWDEVANWGASHGYDISAGGGSGKAANHPVDGVTWYECVKWCNARSEMVGLTPCYYTSSARTTVYRTGTQDLEQDWVRWDAGYRLPTEAEWEKAARGRLSGRRFPWGANINHDYANYRANGSAYGYDTSPYTSDTYHPDYDGDWPYTSPVGAFSANGYGLYDMTGNLWEWCWDRYGYGYYGSSPDTDPRGPASGTSRVRRGGSWIHTASYGRVAYRYSTKPSWGSQTGFRTVLLPDQ